MHHCTPTQSSISPVAVAGTGYTRRTPEKTLLYRLVARHLDDFIAHIAARGGNLPLFLRREFDAFLRCGTFEGNRRVGPGVDSADWLASVACRAYRPSHGVQRCQV